MLKKNDRGQTKPLVLATGSRRTEAVEILTGALVPLLMAGPPGAARPARGGLSAQHAKE